MSYGPKEYQTPNQLKVVSQWFQLKFQLPYSKFITCKILILLCFSVSRSCTYMALSVSPPWEQRGPACGHPLWPSISLVQNFSSLIIAAPLIWVCKIFMRLWSAICVFSFLSSVNLTNSCCACVCARWCALWWQQWSELSNLRLPAWWCCWFILCLNSLYPCSTFHNSFLGWSFDLKLAKNRNQKANLNCNILELLIIICRS